MENVKVSEEDAKTRSGAATIAGEDPERIT